MRSFRFAVTCVAALAFASPTLAQSPQQPAASAQGLSVLQQSLRALTKGTPVIDVTLSGTVRRIAGSDDETGSATLKATVLGDSRIDMAFASGNRTEIRNHAGIPPPDVAGQTSSSDPADQVLQTVGMWSGPDGVLHGMQRHNLMTDAAWFFPAATLTTMTSASSAYVVTYIGQQTLNGESTIQLQITQPIPAAPHPPKAAVALTARLTQMNIFVDPGTLLPVALDFNIHPDDDAGSDIPVEVRFSDYQSVNNMLVPLHVQKYINNGLFLDFQFQNVTLNSGLVPAIFNFQ